MANRGNSPKPDPFSECPNLKCRRKFLASVERCPFCKKKRGDLENHDEEKAKRAEDKANKKAFLETL